jgi:hypothetical protein
MKRTSSRSCFPPQLDDCSISATAAGLQERSETSRGAALEILSPAGDHSTCASNARSAPTFGVCRRSTHAVKHDEESAEDYPAQPANFNRSTTAPTVCHGSSGHCRRYASEQAVQISRPVFRYGREKPDPQTNHRGPTAGDAGAPAGDDSLDT